MNKDDILHLASLARIELSDEEIESFPKQFEEILGFVGQVKDADLAQDEVVRDMQNYNTFRSDDYAHTSGESREEIIEAFPDRQEDYLRVSKVLNN